MQAPQHISQLTEVTCFHKVARMSSEGSEQVLGLLKELSVYKALDEDYRAGSRRRVETQAYGGARAKAAGNKAGNARARCREQEPSVLLSIE